MATTHPTLSEINAIERRAHELRAEAAFAFFAGIRNLVKSGIRRLGFRKPNLVRTFLEA